MESGNQNLMNMLLHGGTSENGSQQSLEGFGQQFTAPASGHTANMQAPLASPMGQQNSPYQMMPQSPMMQQADIMSPPYSQSQSSYSDSSYQGYPGYQRMGHQQASSQMYPSYGQNGSFLSSLGQYGTSPRNMGSYPPSSTSVGYAPQNYYSDVYPPKSPHQQLQSGGYPGNLQGQMGVGGNGSSYQNTAYGGQSPLQKSMGQSFFPPQSLASQQIHSPPNMTANFPGQPPSSPMAQPMVGHGPRRSSTSPVSSMVPQGMPVYSMPPQHNQYPITSTTMSQSSCMFAQRLEKMSAQHQYQTSSSLTGPSGSVVSPSRRPPFPTQQGHLPGMPTMKTSTGPVSPAQRSPPQIGKASPPFKPMRSPPPYQAHKSPPSFQKTTMPAPYPPPTDTRKTAAMAPDLGQPPTKKAKKSTVKEKSSMQKLEEVAESVSTHLAEGLSHAVGDPLERKSGQTTPKQSDHDDKDESDSNKEVDNKKSGNSLPENVAEKDATSIDTETKDHELNKGDQETQLNDEKSTITDQEPKLQGKEPKIKDQESKTKHQEPKVNNQEPKLKEHEEPKMKHQEPKTKCQEHKMNDQDPNGKHQPLDAKSCESDTNVNQSEADESTQAVTKDSELIDKKLDSKIDSIGESDAKSKKEKNVLKENNHDVEETKDSQSDDCKNVDSSKEPEKQKDSDTDPKHGKNTKVVSPVNDKKEAQANVETCKNSETSEGNKDKDESTKADESETTASSNTSSLNKKITVSVKDVQPKTLLSKSVTKSPAPKVSISRSGHPPTIQATVIAKGQSAQSNQQVLVAKTAAGQMYLIQGNVLIPVQNITVQQPNGEKGNKVICVNQGQGKSSHVMVGNITPNLTHKTEKIKPHKPKYNDDSDEDELQGEADDNMEIDLACREKSLLSPTAEMTEGESSHVKGTVSIQTDNNIMKSRFSRPEGESSRFGYNNPRSSPSAASKASNLERSLNAIKAKLQQENQSGEVKKRIGRPPGSKDKHKRKSYLYKRPIPEEQNVPHTSSSNASNDEKRDPTSDKQQRPHTRNIPTVNKTTRSTKRPKMIPPPLSPTKTLLVQPRGGVDGDKWVCSFCGKPPNQSSLGVLYGPYKAKLSRERTDSTRECRSPDKLLSPTSRLPELPTELEGSPIELWMHKDCGTWSQGVYMLGRSLYGLEQAVESAASHKCSTCSEPGATLQCFKRGCHSIYHFACARDSGCAFVEENFTIFCSVHK